MRQPISENQLKITANNPEQEEAEEILDVTYAGTEMEIGFNVNIAAGCAECAEVRECTHSADGFGVEARCRLRMRPAIRNLRVIKPMGAFGICKGLVYLPFRLPACSTKRCVWTSVRRSKDEQERQILTYFVYAPAFCALAVNRR